MGTGHTTQGFKAANAGCFTPFVTLQDSQQNIDLNKLKTDLRLKKLLEKGWTWVIIPWQADDEWPQMADIFQRALNASHEVASKSSELEVAVSIAEAAGDGAQEQDWVQATSVAISGNPPSAAYAPLLRKVAQDYGGGIGAPLLVRLDALAKLYGENKRLGEEFISAVVNMKFLKSEVFPRIRDACFAANLTAPKVIDGVARLLVKTDLSTLTGKQKFADMQRLESDLQVGATIAEAITEKNPELDSKVIGVEGLFKIRSITYSVGKGSKTFEAVDHKSIDAIIRLFMEEVTGLLTENGIADASYLALPASWLNIINNAEAPKTAEPSESATSTAALTTDAVGSKETIALKKGFKVDGMVTESVSNSGIYKIVSISDEVKLLEVDEFKEGCLSVKTPLDKFMRGWKPFSGDVPTFVKGTWGPKVSLFSADAVKAQLMIAMSSCLKAHKVDQRSVKLCLKPTALRANKDFDRHALILVPSVGLNSLSASASATGFDSGFSKDVDGETISIKISKPTQARNSDVEKWEKGEFVNPFWWVTETSDPDEANMIVASMNHGGAKFNILKNRVGLAKHDVLKRYVESVEKRPLKDAVWEKGAPAEKSKAR